MPIYFLVHDADRFHEHIRPALAASWRRRSFEPCLRLCTDLAVAAKSFAERYHLSAEEPFSCQVAAGLPFDRHIWRFLVGEALLYTAAAIPDFQTAPDTLRCLLAPDRVAAETVAREQFSWIEQAHFGTRHLVFGAGCYRPEHAGYNNPQDVARLAVQLSEVEPRRWNSEDLLALPGLATEEERADELEFAREWFPSLQQLYQQAAEQGQLVVCEVL